MLQSTAAERQNIDTRSGRSLVLRCEAATWVPGQEMYAVDNCATRIYYFRLGGKQNHAMDSNPIFDDVSPTLRNTCPPRSPSILQNTC
jgi:hypothetical protein